MDDFSSKTIGSLTENLTTQPSRFSLQKIAWMKIEQKELMVITQKTKE